MGIHQHGYRAYVARDPDGYTWTIAQARPGMRSAPLRGSSKSGAISDIGVAGDESVRHHCLTLQVKPVLTGPGERSGACGLMDDVIGQGREPEPGLRPPLPRRWRVAAWTLAVVAGIAIVGVGLRHGAGSPGTPLPTAAASAADPASVPFVPTQAAPAPQSHPAIVICAPSTGVCSMRGAQDQIVVRVRAG
jgi:hypothetical protein